MPKEQPKNLVGLVFGFWTVLEKHPTAAKYLCKCTCGRENWYGSSHLNKGGTRSCGYRECPDARSLMGLGSKRLAQGESGRNTRIGEYKTAAKARDISWNLSVEEATAFLIGDCAYCGASPVIPRGRTAHARFSSNGIDRVDNSLGYTVENCVSCCKRCNYAKRHHSVKEYVDHALSVTLHSTPFFVGHLVIEEGGEPYNFGVKPVRLGERPA